MARQKISLKIENINHSITHKNSYTVLLAEIGAHRCIPIVVGAFEAQAIAVALENMKPNRPLTHDLIKNIFDSFELVLSHVMITSHKEGVFYSSLVCKSGEHQINIDSRTSDALALALRFGCPIFTYEDLLNEVNIRNNVTEEKEVKVQSQRKEVVQKISKEELEKKLDKALEAEDYELAAKLRDQLNNLEK
jgi:uncharacterized protein